MKEKKRYEIHIYDDICVDLYDNGVLDKSINDTYKLEELLNQQSKRIKELEEELDDAKRDYIPKLEFGLQRANKMGRDAEKENQQLKQQLQKSEKSNEYFADRIEKADKEIKEIYKKYNELVEEYNNIKEEVDNNFVDGQKYNQLKQQLQDLEENYKRLLTCFYSANKRYFEILDKYEDMSFKFKQEEQQLHDLPKKIVCEISESIERLSWRKRIYTNWEFDKEQLYKDLDTILKKYGGGNDLR